MRSSGSRSLVLGAGAPRAAKRDASAGGSSSNECGWPPFPCAHVCICSRQAPAPTPSQATVPRVAIMWQVLVVHKVVEAVGALDARHSLRCRCGGKV